MITFTNEFTEHQVMKIFRAPILKNTAYDRWFIFPLCWIGLGVTLLWLFEHPHDWKHWFVAVAIIFALTYQTCYGFLLRRKIRRHPFYGKTVTWTLDESGFQGECYGFSLEQPWTRCPSASLITDGIIFRGEQGTFYWPVEGFQTANDFRAAAALVLAHVKKVVIMDDPAGVTKK